MPSLQLIESQVASLPEQELRKFRSWFDEFDALRWDHSLTQDIGSGKLDSFAAEALAQYGASHGRNFHNMQNGFNNCCTSGWTKIY